jgi:hypothetical protein
LTRRSQATTYKLYKVCNRAAGAEATGEQDDDTRPNMMRGEGI